MVFLMKQKLLVDKYMILDMFCGYAIQAVIIDEKFYLSMMMI